MFSVIIEAAFVLEIEELSDKSFLQYTTIGTSTLMC